MAVCRAHGVTILTEDDEQYPRLLREIHDPPGVLFVKGSLHPQDALAVAIVGTRHATQYGLRQAERLAASLARTGLTIVSGLARGVDAAAHRGALAAGGRTLAVLGSGVLNVTGTIYGRDSDIFIEGGASGTVNSALLGYTVDVGGNGDLTVTYNPDENYKLPDPPSMEIVE